MRYNSKDVTNKEDKTFMNKKRYNPDFNFDNLYYDTAKKIKTDDNIAILNNIGGNNIRSNNISNNINNNINNYINNNNEYNPNNLGLNLIQYQEYKVPLNNENDFINEGVQTNFNDLIKSEIINLKNNDKVNSNNIINDINMKIDSIIDDIYDSLPITKKRDQIITQIKENQCTIISGETGCGKTTQVPKYIIESCPGAKILMTQPRRIAVVSIYER